MKKLICWLLALTLAATCTLPVGAVDSEQIEGDPATIPVTVTTIEELLEAIENAEDGDTIRIGATIDVSENTSIGSSEKRLTLIRSEDMADREVFSCAAPATLENLIIDGNGGSERLIWISADATLSGLTIRNSNGGGIYVQGGIVTIDGCSFEDNTALSGAHLRLFAGAMVSIIDTTFVRGFASGGWGGAIDSRTDMTITGCTFMDNSASEGGGAIYAPVGSCMIRNSTITRNMALHKNGGGIFNMGSLELDDTKIYGNAASLNGADVFSNGNLNISVTDNDLNKLFQIEGREPLGFYIDDTDARFDGTTNITETKELPISLESAVSALIFVFEDDIYVQEPEQENPDEGKDQGAEAPAAGQEQETAQSPGLEASQEQDQAKEATQEPAQEREPEPEQPSAPSESPPNVPSNGTHSSSHTRPSKDNDISEPTASPTQQQETEQALTVLSCGGATLNTSDRAFLAGYGDGVIGEDDHITRAQIAQIIYRLLNDESRETLQTTENSFDDVPTGAWYNLAVSTIARAGIVVGYGDSFHPEGYLTRAQLITIMARFVAPVECESSFTDISGHWAESFVSTAEAVGWLDGGGDLRPDEHVTRGEVVSFINHAFDLCEKTE